MSNKINNQLFNKINFQKKKFKPGNKIFIWIKIQIISMMMI